ncbi:AlbA family DNA-binding domain-containing protein [Haladaptatus cibarius]|uniref:AlbA family DNA-binding domain-containing protein n=1 Tax=Haladaptatus cibarius TaxID=453847 RepID=UPI000A039132|nr:ATP-binding protein [Haladaptatus cibarius]
MKNTNKNEESDLTVEIYEQEEASVEVSDIEYAIDNGRGDKTEFYEDISGENDGCLAITACSLANNGGGQILLGVDKEGEKKGVQNTATETVREILIRDLERRWDTKFVISEVEIDGKRIIIIIIDKFKKYPLTADGRFYLRHQDEDLLLPPHEVYRMMKNIQSELDD